MSTDTIKHVTTVFPVDADAINPRRRRQRPGSIVYDFALNTATHGIPGIARSQSIPNRIFWSICSLIFTGVMIYFITESIRNYFDYPTQTLVSLSSDINNPPFPAFSFCNYCPLRFDQFIGPFLNYTNSRNLTNTTDLTIITEEQANYIQDFFQYKLNRNESSNDYFYSLDSMLISCQYNGLNCTTADFVSFVTSEYGLCYTFNAKTDLIRNGTLHQLGDNGQWGILELELYIQSHLYVPYFFKATGLIGLLHDNQQLPIMSLDGNYFNAGQRHKISYGRKTHYLLGSPYSECSSTVPLMVQAAYDRLGSVHYTYDEFFCFIICTQVYIYDQCGCVSPDEWAAQSVVLPGTTKVIEAPLCNISDKCAFDAAEKFSSDESIWNGYCTECIATCTQKSVISYISSMNSPPDWSLPRLKSNVESLSAPLPINWSDTWRTEIVQNYVAFEIVVGSEQVENFNETASILPVDLISNVGGQTGLWIGVSFLSLMELVEMLFRLVRYQFYRLRDRRREERG